MPPSRNLLSVTPSPQSRISRIASSICLCALMTSACIPLASRPALAQSSDPAEIASIQNLLTEYATAVDRADTALAAHIWSHSPDASFINPAGHEHGVAQITDEVYRHLMGDTFFERSLNIHPATIHVYGDTAWSEFDWDFYAKLRSNGAPFESHGRETQIYRKENGQWHILHVHYSPMPTTGNARF